MSDKAQELAQLYDILPENFQKAIANIIDEMIYVWDPDFVKATPKEAQHLKEARESGYIVLEDDDWDHLDEIDID